MTNQEVFDIVKTHLLTQMQPARLGHTDFGSCQYRTTKDGRVLKCAVGCLIPDDQYDPAIEGRGVQSMEVQHRIPGGGGISEVLLAQLQAVHDQWPPELWERELRAVAERHGLTWQAGQAPGAKCPDCGAALSYDAFEDCYVCLGSPAHGPIYPSEVGGAPNLNAGVLHLGHGCRYDPATPTSTRECP